MNTTRLLEFNYRCLLNRATSTMMIIVAVGLFFSPAKTRALTIDFINTGEAMSDQQLAAIDTAAYLWESRFSDPITVTINLEKSVEFELFC